MEEEEEWRWEVTIIIFVCVWWCERCVCGVPTNLPNEERRRKMSKNKMMKSSMKIK